MRRAIALWGPVLGWTALLLLGSTRPGKDAAGAALAAVAWRARTRPRGARGG